jgi:hypothetical protein
LTEHGYSRQLARQRAQSITEQIMDMKENVGGFVGVERGLGGQHSEQQIRQRLIQAGVEERDIDRLERQNFPPGQVEDMVEDALTELGYREDRARERAWQVAQEIRQMQRLQQQRDQPRDQPQSQRED